MDKLSRIGQILDSCLTVDTLDEVYPYEKSMDEIFLSLEGMKARHDVIRAYFLERVRSIVERETGEKLWGENLALVRGRSNQFLINHHFFPDEDNQGKPALNHFRRAS